MKVVVLSDLHIDDTSKWNAISEEMLKRIRNIAKENERIIFVLLGDIVNGFRERTTEDIQRFYKKADSFLDTINNGLKEKSVEFYFTPGNHDLDGNSLESFNEFIKRHSRINDSPYAFTLNESVFTFDIDDFRFILVDSNLSRDYNARGQIDGKLLKFKGVTEKQIVLFMHHPPYNRESYSDYDDKALDNPLDIMFLHAKYVFYGHQHGDHKEDLYKNRDTIYVPVTGLFNKGQNIRNGFAVLNIQDNKIISCYQYEFDGARFHKIIISPEKAEKRHDELLIETHDYSKELQEILSRHFYQYDSINDAFELTDIVRENDFVIITGEAGIGKTYEAHRLYQLYKNDDEYYPIIIDLRCTTIEIINRYIEYACKYRIENKDVLLIIDGFSESTSSIFNGALSTLCNLPDENLCIKVIVTKRDNYELKFFDSYHTFHISAFNDEDIKTYLTMRRVQDIPRFMQSISASDYGYVIGIPFVLNAVIDIYSKDRSIPKFNNLMQQIISLRFMEADNSLSNKYQIMPVEHEVIISLEELGFVMQAVCEHPLANIYYSQLFDEKIQLLQSYTGLLYRDDNYRRDYNHEIFAEYFISDYICNLDLSDILKIITYQFESNFKIKKTWYDVVRRIIDMRSNDDLLKWIMENDNDVLIYNVPEKMINNSESVRIVEYVLNDCFTKNLPIHTVISDIERFVNLHASKAMWDLITKELFTHHNEYGLSTILQIICCAKQNDMDRNVVQGKLIEIITDEHPKYIKSLALRALTKLNECVDEYIDKVIESLSDETDMDVILCVFSIISRCSNPDNYFKYAVDRFEKAERSYIYLRFDESFLNIIISLRSLTSMIESIKYMCESDAFARIYNTSRIFELVIDKITECVIKEHSEEFVFNEMYDCFIRASHQIDGRKTECIKKFFVNIGKLDEVLYAIINEKNSLNFCSGFESIISSELIDKLIQYYFDGVFSESQFSWYINRYSVSENDKARLKDAYKTKHGKEIQLHEKSEWAINHDAAEREFFNSLFERNLFECKVRNLIALFEHDIPILQFFEKWFSMIPEDKQDLQMIGGLIHRSVGNIDLLFSEFILQYNWENFQFIALLEFIETKDTFTMELNEPQRTFLQKKFNEILEHTNYEAISYESPESQNIRFVTALISKFGFNCNDEKLLEMIMLPWYVFASSSVSKSSDVISFIQKHISDETKLQNRIVFNLEHKELSIYAQANHISYCMENELTNAINVAVNLFESTDSHAEYLKYIAIEYLLRITSEEYIDKLISNKTEDTILKYLSSRLLTYNNNLVAEMIARNEKSSDYFLFIGELIILNIKYGVKKYSDFIREHLTIPELFNQEYSNLDITLQLRKLKNVSLIGEVTDLLLTAYSKDFLDRDDVWGLKGSLDNVFMIMCKENPEQVKQYMEKLLNADQNNDEFIFKCNYFLSLCEETLISLSVNDGCWTFQDAIKYVRNRRLDS